MLKCKKKIGRRNSRMSLCPNFFLARFLAKKNLGVTGAKILRIVSLLILKAEFLKKIWPIDTSLYTVDVTQLARVFELFQSLAMFTLLYLP